MGSGVTVAVGVTVGVDVGSSAPSSSPYLKINGKKILELKLGSSTLGSIAFVRPTWLLDISAKNTIKIIKRIKKVFRKNKCWFIVGFLECIHCAVICMLVGT
ncbi:MAG: hypothetical protein AAF639_17235 [Chloroflexota bacterium]